MRIYDLGSKSEDHGSQVKTRPQGIGPGQGLLGPLWVQYYGLFLKIGLPKARPLGLAQNWIYFSNLVCRRQDPSAKPLILGPISQNWFAEGRTPRGKPKFDLSGPLWGLLGPLCSLCGALFGPGRGREAPLWIEALCFGIMLWTSPA